MRETAFRIAFREAAVKYVEKHGKRSHLVERVVKAHDQGSGLKRAR